MDPQTIEEIPKSGCNIEVLQRELQAAATDMSTYLSRVQDASDWWQCEWPNQFTDGRVHPDGWPDVKGGDCWPWNGASDSRLRLVEGIVNEHVVLDLVAFWSAKVQCESQRPFIYGRQSNVAEKMLKWRVYKHMKRELLRELPLAFTWKHALGVSFMGIEWEQVRDIVMIPVSVDQIAQAAAALGFGDVIDRLMDVDKEYDDELIDALMRLSPVLPKGDARKILESLRLNGAAELPVVSFRINKPVWTAMRPGIDVLIPSETVDVQAARFVAKREKVDQATLEDRIVTEGYDPRFVDVASQHKGKFSTYLPYTVGPGEMEIGSDRDLIDLIHVFYRKLHNGVPCTYRTVFNDFVAKDTHNELYAVHRRFEYDHQQYPLVAFRRRHSFRPLLSSIGIADEAYTDELDMKRQQDGINNRTDLIHKPPMIVPTLRAQAVKNAYGPNAVMTASRPNEVTWAPLPPFDETPILCMQQVQMRLDRRYGIIGGAVDPEIKAVRRQQLAMQCLSEIELCLEQTLQLQQQYETDEDVQRVAGGNQPWKLSAKDIQGMYEISATVDMKVINLEYAQMKLDMLGKIIPFKQSGGVVFKAAAELVDPDLADQMTEDEMSPAAMERERNDEYNAVSQILSGIEAVKPMMANPQFRLQTIQQIMTDPGTMQKVSQDPIAQKRLKNRVEFFQNQIQQYTANPAIGRALSTTTFGSNAPVVSQQPAQ